MSRKQVKILLSYVRRGVILFIVLLGLTLIVHETAHLIVARFLGYQANVFYGIEAWNVYGYVVVNPPITNPIHAAIVYSAGGIVAGLVMLLLWSSIYDVLARTVFSFFIAYQFTYSIMESLYGFRMIEKSTLDMIPLMIGLVVFTIFLLKYPAYRRRAAMYFW